MPQLPSGRHVGLTIAPALAMSRAGDFGFHVTSKLYVNSLETFKEVVSVAYLRPREGAPDQLEQYQSGMRLSDIGADRCDWSREDIEYFDAWLKQDTSQQWLRDSYDEFVATLQGTKAVIPDALKGLLDVDDDYPVYGTGQPDEELPGQVITLIGELIKRDNVQSVSCPFSNSKIWRLLVKEQARRAELTGLPKQEAFNLAGPDGGFGFDPREWGGEVHVPYMGACIRDLFVVPEWRNLFPEEGAAQGNDATLLDYLGAWVYPPYGDHCHYLLVQRDLGELSCAYRHVVGDGWILYESNRPYVKSRIPEPHELPE